MKFSLSLLKQFIQFNNNYSATEIASYITSLGFEVEDINDLSIKYKNFVVAEIVECVQHSESERLSLCKVNNGNAILNVVCGAKNARTGIKVVLANIGAIVPENKMEIKKGSIRGAVSEGMLCSASELSLSNESDGILELPLDAKVGQPLSSFLKIEDVIFEISITPNRGDGACIFGIARDLSCKGLGTLIKSNSLPSPACDNLKINIQENLPEVYFGKANLKQNLECILQDVASYKNVWGTSEIDVVDYVNLQMFKYGMPMHIYDASKIKGEITIRRSVINEKFVPIKGEPFELSEGLLIVADEEKILSLLGVMGDARSKTESTTKEIILEAIYAPSTEIIKSSRATGIKSDSSYRFERGIDRNQKNIIINTLTAISQNVTAFFAHTQKEEKRIVLFNLADFEKRMGYKIEAKKAHHILQNLGFEIEQKDNIFNLQVPFYRNDISIPEDICEEIARINGYENIVSILLPAKPIENYDLNFEIKKILSEEMVEVITYSFFKEKHFGLFSDCKKKIDIVNPITSDFTTMRDSLIPNLLEAISKNEKHNYLNLKLFEVGSVFYGTTKEEQKTNIAFILAGFKNLQSFITPEKEFTIWDAKQKMLEILERLWGISENALILKLSTNSSLHTKQGFEIFLGKMKIAILGQLHPETLREFDIKQKAFICEIFINNLPAINVAKKNKFTYKEDILPDITREIAIIIKREIKFEEISSLVKKLKISALKEIQVKDIFESKERIGEGLKSILIQFILKQEKETLTKEIIDGEIIGSIISELSLKLDAKIRDGEVAK